MYGFTISRPIAHAWLLAAADVGTKVEIEYFGRRVAGTIAAEPLFDPAMNASAAG